jgi:hypothetical protein
MARPRIEKPVTSAFATLTPFRNKAFELWERVIYVNSWGLRVQEPTIRALTFLQHAQWVTVPKSRRGRRANGPMPRTSLLFMSYFTGDLFDYLRGFTTKLSESMDLLWNPCAEWPNAENYAGTVAFIEKFRREVQVYYNGRGELNVGAARVSVETRKKLDKLRAEIERGMSEDRFRAAYLDVASTSTQRDVEPPAAAPAEVSP